jgi:hypothetical protein
LWSSVFLPKDFIIINNISVNPLCTWVYTIGSQSAARGPMAARRNIPCGPQWHTDVILIQTKINKYKEKSRLSPAFY